jgi:hypothetical protein
MLAAEPSQDRPLTLHIVRLSWQAEQIFAIVCNQGIKVHHTFVCC